MLMVGRARDQFELWEEECREDNDATWKKFKMKVQDYSTRRRLEANYAKNKGDHGGWDNYKEIIKARAKASPDHFMVIAIHAVSRATPQNYALMVMVMASPKERARAQEDGVMVVIPAILQLIAQRVRAKVIQERVMLIYVLIRGTSSQCSLITDLQILPHQIVPYRIGVIQLIMRKLFGR